MATSFTVINNYNGAITAVFVIIEIVCKQKV